MSEAPWPDGSRGWEEQGAAQEQDREPGVVLSRSLCLLESDTIEVVEEFFTHPIPVGTVLGFGIVIMPFPRVDLEIVELPCGHVGQLE